jgi:hypothetical protein
MAILEFLFELICDLVFDVLFELIKKVLLAICRAVTGLTRWIVQLRRGRPETVYFKRGRSLREPVQRGLVFSPTRRRR